MLLKIGSTGKEVAIVQNNLKILGYDSSYRLYL